MERIKTDSIDILLSNAEELMEKANKWENLNGNKISLYEAMNLVIALDSDDRQRNAFFEKEKYDENAVWNGWDSKRSTIIVNGSAAWATFTPETPIEGKPIKSIKIPGYDKWIDLIGMSYEDERALLDYLGGATISDPSNFAMDSEIKVKEDVKQPISNAEYYAKAGVIFSETDDLTDGVYDIDYNGERVKIHVGKAIDMLLDKDGKGIRRIYEANVIDDTATPESDDTDKKKKSPCGAKYLPL